MNNIDAHMQENILNYGDSIQTIDNFVDAVRKTVGQYLGYIDTRGHINMIREIYQNSIDEMIKSNSPCHEIWITYNESTLETTVRDNGRGIPFGNMVRTFATQHTSSNYSKKKGEYSSGRHGVGSKVTNACSKQFIVESYLFNGTARTIQFFDGHPWDKGEIEIPNPNHYQGTKITFIPALEVMKDVNTKCEDVLELIVTLLYLTPSGIGNTVHFEGIKTNGNVIKQDIVNQDGISTFLIAKLDQPVVPIILLSADNGTIKTDIAFTYDSKCLSDEEDIISFANMCPTVNSKSSHVEGFLTALTNYFRTYMNKIYLYNSKTKVVPSDIKSGLKAVVTVSHIEPLFSGQAKEIFSNKDVIPFIAEVLETQLNEWVKSNSNQLQRLCKYFKDVAELRMSEENHRINYIKKIKDTSVISGLPSKYNKPAGKDHLELLITEGDSAVSQANRARDPMKQGTFPIRGKIINPLTNSREKVLENEEVCGIAAILGAGIGRNFDLGKCRFEKVIALTDADEDGLNIRQLLMKLFLMEFKPIIEDGRFYLAVPPLYSINNRKGITFFTTKKDYIEFLVSKFSSEYKVLSDSKKQFTNKELESILYYNNKYIEELSVISTNYGIDPQLLEYIIRYRTMPIEWQKKFFKNKYRFLSINMKQGVMVLDGLVGCKYYTIVCNEQLYSVTSTLFHYMDKSLEYYYVNGEKYTLYQLMQLFEKFKPSGVQRYKGLGEMPVKDLRVSTIHPDGNRTLLRITVDDIKKQIDELRAIQTDLSSLLKNADIAGYEI